jgi:hypothetical protein
LLELHQKREKSGQNGRAYPKSSIVLGFMDHLSVFGIGGNFYTLEKARLLLTKDSSILVHILATGRF